MILRTIAVQNLHQLCLSLIPVYGFAVLIISAGITYSLFIKRKMRFGTWQTTSLAIFNHG